MTMFTRLPALAFLLFASILAAAQSGNSYWLRTEVPYTLSPHTAPIVVGEAAPARIGNNQCPRAVTFTFPGVPGVPIKFSTSLRGRKKSVFIDEDTDVYITFNGTVDCGKNIWADTMLSPVPGTVPLELMASADFRIYAPTIFRIKRERSAYRLYSPRTVEDGVAEYNIVGYEDQIFRFGLSKDEYPLLFNINEVENYDIIGKSVF